MKNEPKTWVDNPRKLKAILHKKKLYINGLTFDLATLQGELRNPHKAKTFEELEQRIEKIKAELLEIETNPHYRPWINSNFK